MIGTHSGVATLLKQNSPWLIANHCVAHRLALASAQAADEIPYLKNTVFMITQHSVQLAFIIYSKTHSGKRCPLVIT